MSEENTKFIQLKKEIALRLLMNFNVHERHLYKYLPLDYLYNLPEPYSEDDDDFELSPDYIKEQKSIGKSIKRHFYKNNPSCKINGCSPDRCICLAHEPEKERFMKTGLIRIEIKNGKISSIYFEGDSITIQELIAFANNT